MEDYKRLLGYVRPHLPLFVVAITAMVLTALFETVTGGLLVPLIDQFQPAYAQNNVTVFNLQKLIPKNDWFRAWIALTVLLLTFSIIKGFTSFCSSYLMSKIGQSVVLELRRELYSHLLRQSTAFYDRHRTNFLVSRLITSCVSIELAVSANLRDVLREIFMLIFFVSAAFYFNWRLMLGALIVGPVIAILTSRFSSAMRKLADTTLKGNQRLTDTAQETLANETIVKAYSAEKNELSRFSKVAELIARANLRSGKIAAMSPPVIEVIGIVLVVIFFYFGYREINIGNMQPSQFFTFLFFLFRSYDPMRKISRQHNEISKAFAAARDIWDVLDEDEQLPTHANAKKITGLKSGITVEDLVFGYSEDESNVINGVSFEIKRGETVALVGESGGGKSTLIRLLLRLYDPLGGSIKWDGTDLRDIDLATLRKQTALVTQETVLFNDTVKYNIAYGAPDATDESIANAARIAFADEFIQKLPLKYDTVVGERGSFLSGGQRQRIAIARAVLVNAPVLIMDEATSALDAESELLVKRALDNLMVGKTSVVIAHRLSTVRRADKIFVMENGRIIEEGSHDVLIEKNATYKRLYDLQFSDEDSEVYANPT